MSEVDAYLQAIDHPQRRQDCDTLRDLMHAVTGRDPQLWSGQIVGFGRYHYRYDSGREGDWFLTGFASRKKALSIYIVAGLDRYPQLLQKLGPHSTGKSCLYVKKLDDIDLDVLRELIARSVEHLRATHGAS